MRGEKTGTPGMDFDALVFGKIHLFIFVEML